MKACNTTCCQCGKKFDRFSGQLVNIADERLKEFYALPPLQQAIKEHKHPCLCADCLEKYINPLSFFKFKNNRWMTSNLAWLLRHRGLLETYADKLQSEDDHGLLPYKHNAQDTAKMYKAYGLI